MWEVRAASGGESGRPHTVGFIALGLAVSLTFLVLWAVFFRGAGSEVSHQGGEAAALATTPAPGGTPVEDKATESAVRPAAAPRSAGRSSKGAPVPEASGGNGTARPESTKSQEQSQSLDEPTGALTTETVSPDRAKTQYEAFAADYAAASRGVGTLTSDTRPAQLQAAVRQAAAAYEVWISQLQSTSWPPEVQPYVDDYLALATTKGRALFEHGLHARSVDDLQGAQAMSDMFELSHAQELMRGAMGVSE